jgi:ABC-type dipeptide/oligopeptide/nickel transport system permease component
MSRQGTAGVPARVERARIGPVTGTAALLVLLRLSTIAGSLAANTADSLPDAAGTMAGLVMFGLPPSLVALLVTIMLVHGEARSAVRAVERGTSAASAARRGAAIVLAVLLVLELTVIGGLWALTDATWGPEALLAWLVGLVVAASLGFRVLGRTLRPIMTTAD